MNEEKDIPGKELTVHDKHSDKNRKPEEHFPEDNQAPKFIQSENMEVHKHPHHVTNKKKWGEYFLEFLMLFLAVTLGFIAENIRERITESHREKEFAQQLYAELKEDSTVLANKIADRKQKEKAMEWVASYFADSSLEHLPGKFYPALSTSLYLINRYAFEPKDGMLSQLRNSGSLRYFKSVHLQKLIGDISVSINNVRERNNEEYQYWSDPVKPFMLKYFDFGWLMQLRKVNDSTSIGVLVADYDKYDLPGKGTIRNLSILDRNEATNIILFYKIMLTSTRTLQLNEYFITNHKILQELRENYSLEKE